MLVKDNRCQKLGVRIANTHTEYAVAIDHGHDFFMCGDHHCTLTGQKRYHAVAIFKTAEGQLADDGWVAEETVVFNDPT